VENQFTFLGGVSAFYLNHSILGWIVNLILIILLVVFVATIIRVYTNRKRSLKLIFLRIKVPKREDKEGREMEGDQFGTQKDFIKQVGIMTHMLESLHAMKYERLWERWVRGQDFFSLEIAAIEGQIYFYIVVPQRLMTLFQKSLTSFYSDAFIEEVPEYNLFAEGCKANGCYLKLKKHFLFPIKTAQRINSEPLNGILNSMSKLNKNESAALQLVLRPRWSGWQKKGKDYAKEIFHKNEVKSFWSKINPLHWLKVIVGIFAIGTDGGTFENVDMASGSTRTTPQTDEMVKAIEEKGNHAGWDTVLRIVATGPSQSKATENMMVIRNAFGQYGAPHLNEFERVRYYSPRLLIINFIYRTLWRNWTQRIFFWHKTILGSEELSSLWHIPAAKFNDVANVAWQRFRITPPPDNVPDSGLHLGYNLHRGVRKEIYLNQSDRYRHLYLIGQTGTGKSVFLDFLIKQDLRSGMGCCVVDPHGDLVEQALGWIPRERADDVIVFDPSDIERPLGLNMLEADTPEEKDFIALEAMNMMIGLFGNEIFGPRIQDYFRNGCLTLMDDPDGGALTDIVRLFTDDAWQKHKVDRVKNPVVKSFWVNQMANTGQREKQEMIPYFAAKFGSFITNSLMRNIIGQTKSAFRFDEVMDNKKILLCKLSKGLIGDINANLLGMIFVNKIQVAAMRRQSKPSDERIPFILYVDEFQNFITDSFESILSEARKYRLGLVIAHQYIDQLISGGGGKSGGEQEKVKNAVFGNVGTMMNLKIGAKDAEYMAKEMGPVFGEGDLINLEAFNACIKENISNQISRPFSLKTIKWWEETPDDKPDKEVAEALTQLSRLKYGRDKDFVSREIIRRIGASTKSAEDSGPKSNPLTAGPPAPPPGMMGAAGSPLPPAGQQPPMPQGPPMMPQEPPMPPPPQAPPMPPYPPMGANGPVGQSFPPSPPSMPPGQ
jgi:hypothetical protein